LNELSTTPDNTNGEQSFTITHPFHPLYGQTFSLLAQHMAWGEERVFFLDPQTHEARSLPLAWTSLALPDPFLVVASGQTVLRLRDVQDAGTIVQEQAGSWSGGSLIWFRM
jgi:hypothetical protein